MSQNSVTQPEAMPKSGKKKWWRGPYLIIIGGLLLSVLLGVAIFLFWDKLPFAQGYGYVTGFTVSIFGGITVIPIPNLAIVLTLAHKLNPLYLGLLVGLGESVGGITIYLTGTGGGAMWAKLREERDGFYDQPEENAGEDRPRRPSRWQRLYRRFAGSIGRRQGLWAVFITSAFLWCLYYPVGIACGSFRIGIKRFFLVSLLGKTVRGLMIAYAGYWGLTAILQWTGG